MFEEYSNVITKIDNPIGGELGERFERIGDPQHPEVIIASPHTSLTRSQNWFWFQVLWIQTNFGSLKVS